MKSKILLSIICILFVSSGISAKNYQASLFGVRSDGITTNTGSIQYAINYISENGGGNLVFYVGRYLTGSIELKSNVTIILKEGAALVAVPTAYDYKSVGGHAGLIIADSQKNIGITGEGVIEEYGDKIKANVEKQEAKGYLEGKVTDYLPSLICFNNCENINIDQVILQNQCNTAMVFKDCKNVTINKNTVHSGTLDCNILSLSGCNGIKLTDCFYDTMKNPIESDATSQNVTFKNCIISNGNTVSVDK